MREGTYMTMRFLLAPLRFPRPDLEGRWWHRMFKVLIPLCTIVVFFMVLRWENDIFEPYYVYSFDSDFGKYSGQTKRLSEVDLSSSRNVSTMILSFRHSSDERDRYIETLDKAGKSDYAIIEQLKREGLLDGVLVKDLRTDFASGYQKYAFVIGLTLLFYLAILHILYRLIAYIFAGKPKAV